MAKFTKSKEEVVAILSRCNNDELKELHTQIFQVLCDNPKDSAVSLFLKVFYAQPTGFHRGIGITRIYEWLIELRKAKKELDADIDDIKREIDKIVKILSDEDGYIDIERVRRNKLLQREYPNHIIETLNLKITYILLNRLFEHIRTSNETFWNVIEVIYDKDEAKDLKRFNFHAIQNMIEESRLFNEDGILDENIQFRHLCAFAESKFLWLTFNDTSLEIKYRRTMSEYYRN